MHIAGGSVFLLQGRRQIFQGGTGQGAKSFGYGGAGQQSNSGHFRGRAGWGRAVLKIFGAAIFHGAWAGRASLVAGGADNAKGLSGLWWAK